ncbi:MAG: flagellar basal body P-ring protein FlgI [Syntrophobacterales bacterium]|nr:flagellar basal body P-ring protein FlgI [Syntrophobacterales bacterium]
MMMKKIKGMGKILGICMSVLLASLTTAHGARIKDIADFDGVRDNQLIGYGLVVGLAKTGDNVKNGFTRETLTNMLSRQGLSMRDKDIKANNVASVMVTASMPPFAKIGTKIDVVVSSIGDATSLQGGTLLMTPLKGSDGEIYAVAQGAIALGGYTAGTGNTTTVRNHPSVGRIASGAFVEKELHYALDTKRTTTIQLQQPDFTTAKKMAEAIKASVPGIEVNQRDGRSVTVTIGPDSNMVDILSRIENLNVSVDAPAVVVMNEKTGTVVMGENVRISTVAVSHGNLNIQIREEYEVSQPSPFAPAPSPYGGTSQKSVTTLPGGQTVVTTTTTISTGEEKNQLMVVPKGVTIQDMVRGLNAIGVTPRDLITILQTIKAAGALQADLKMI